MQVELAISFHEPSKLSSQAFVKCARIWLMLHRVEAKEGPGIYLS